MRWFALASATALSCGGVALQEPADGCAPGRCLEHTLAEIQVEAREEVEGICFSWTVGNAEPLLVNAVTSTNEGGIHHSNWFWVPEDRWNLPDGTWNCWDQGFNELGAAIAGGVLFAQSTQVAEETQRFLPGVVVEVGPRARIIASAHLLNSLPDPIDTRLSVRLELLPEREVDLRLAPFRMTYHDLDIPPHARSEHHGDCELSPYYPSGTFEMKLHYVLPHFHGLGDGFELNVLGGPRDGEVLYDIWGAYGHPLGSTFPEPIELSGADGLSFSCHHDNGTDERVGWGIGDQEMCVMLGFAESEMMFDLTVDETRERADEPDGTAYRTGPCRVLALPAQD